MVPLHNISASGFDPLGSCETQDGTANCSLTGEMNKNSNVLTGLSVTR